MEIMFEGSTKLLTEIYFKIHWFGISRLQEIFSDFSEQEVGPSRFNLKIDVSTFLDFSGEKSNLRLETKIELKLLTTAQISEVFIFNLPLFSGKLLCKKMSL